ncbi:hypothetical protein BS47DRAFT_1337797 [Hydnum rufescens UP504]|uniref:Cytochrome b561 domain-containing protein n=1 Tax=Hydnum rufescens UP504 TaxID=1448309 RepID=A0A9P6E151_9AGAM|nr:hypothetical protein BS47DRAFT_1337797 [Hydnum rufescens UP504]
MSNENDFEPGDAISLFYVYFGILLFLPYTIVLILLSTPSQLGWFAYHPPLLALAFGALAHGITVLQPTSRPESVTPALATHQIFVGFLGVPLLVTAASLQYLHKENLSIDHFTSWHGLIGATTALAIVVQAAFGGLLGAGIVSRKYYRAHRLSGYVIFSLASLAFTLGGLFSTFVVSRTWSATRFIAYGLGPLSVWGGLVTRARPKKLQ